MSVAAVGMLGIVVLLAMLFFLGTPVAVAMAVVGFAGFAYLVSPTAALGVLSTDLWEVFSNYGLTVIPTFILMGQVAFHAGVNKRLYKVAHVWIGHIRGGIAMATVGACAAFSAICGSNTATAATMTSVALPEMKRYKYNPKLGTGAVAAGSTLGVVIPPSVLLIVIGLNTGESIGKLFYGGFAAGAVLCLAMMLTAYVICVRKPAWGPPGPRVAIKERLGALPGAIEMLLLFVFVMTGLYVGFFTPSEAGATGAFLAVAIAVVQGKLSWRGFLDALMETLVISCMVILIIAGATIFSRFLAVTRIPFDIAAWVQLLPLPSWVIITFILIIYAVGGCVMDGLALLLITIPIFFPVATQLGYDPIWFSVVVTVVTTLGAISPPVGVSAYVVSGMAPEVPLKEVFKGILYFIPAFVASIAIMMIFPRIITLLPSLFM